MARISASQSVLHRHRSMLSHYVALTFPRKPASLLDPLPEPTNDGDGARFKSALRWLLSEKGALQALPSSDSRDADHRLDRLIKDIQFEIQRYEQFKEDVWDQEKLAAGLYGLGIDDLATGPLIIDPAVDASLRRKKLEPFILAALLFVTVLHALAASNRLTAQYGLTAFQVMLFGAFMYCNISHGQPRALSDNQLDLLATIPDDI
ncbi:hypothetical protein TRAPUB_460 [Trametes pubescens]|uniref:Uncharacterized protein n=1 Tax=Trametes pubescens TaxID=154538 RepID=A0A1M2VM15_TRAPU|nr:hypothetical protein TRAPUB_460 [Trametes pubescens]